MLPAPTPYSESDLLSLYWLFCAFLPDFFNTFLIFSIFLVSYTKFWFTEFCFLTAFFSGTEIGFLLSVFLKLQQSPLLCMVYVPPCLLHRLQCSLMRTFMRTLAVDLIPGHFFPFLSLGEAFSENSGLAFSWVQTRLIASSRGAIRKIINFFAPNIIFSVGSYVCILYDLACQVVLKKITHSQSHGV